MIIIAFRGTEPTSLQDWMPDVNIRRKAGPYGKVHRGFLKSFQVVWPEIRAVITEWQTQAQSLWLTGHSLGAALATLGMASLGEEVKPVHGSIPLASRVWVEKPLPEILIWTLSRACSVL